MIKDLRVHVKLTYSKKLLLIAEPTQLERYRFDCVGNLAKADFDSVGTAAQYHVGKQNRGGSHDWCRFGAFKQREVHQKRDSGRRGSVVLKQV